MLVFSIFRDTQKALTTSLSSALAGQADVVLAEKDRLGHDARDRFREVPDGRSLVLVARDEMSESIDLDGGNPCVVHHDLPWNPARIRQRMGRVCRISSGYAAIKPEDTFVPYLDIAADERLATTVMQRQRFAAALATRDAGELEKVLAVMPNDP
ncbi:MAG: SWF/SNF helicase family protein [bacterium]|nr:SWF/SNF helicase family protein [bacterium]